MEFSELEGSSNGAFVTLESLAPRWIQDSRYVLGPTVGFGASAVVVQCMSDSGKLYAVKKLSLSDRAADVQAAAREISIMKRLSHENIVPFIGAKVDQGRVLLIFLEWVTGKSQSIVVNFRTGDRCYCSGGSVAKLLSQFGPFKEAIVRNYAKQILTGLQYLHNHGIIHR
jgi:serine/threonine protein kinase